MKSTSPTLKQARLTSSIRRLVRERGIDAGRVLCRGTVRAGSGGEVAEKLLRSVELHGFGNQQGHVITADDGGLLFMIGLSAVGGEDGLE